MRLSRSLSRIALALLIAAMAGWAVYHRDQINLTTLDAWLAALGPWAPIGYVILFAMATVAFVPGVVFSLAGGALFGPLWGSLWNLAGATLGATLAFLIARYIAADWVSRRAGGLLKRLIDGVDAEGWRFVGFVRLVPLFPFNLSNLRARAHAHSTTPLRHSHAGLHGAGGSSLYLARLCRTRRLERRSERGALWPSRAWSSCDYCRIATPDWPVAQIIRMD